MHRHGMLGFIQLRASRLSPPRFLSRKRADTYMSTGVSSPTTTLTGTGRGRSTVHRVMEDPLACEQSREYFPKSQLGRHIEASAVVLPGLRHYNFYTRAARQTFGGKGRSMIFVHGYDKRHGFHLGMLKRSLALHGSTVHLRRPKPL